MTHWTEHSKFRRACEDGLAEARRYDTMQAWWDETERGDWMLWVAGRLAGPPGSDSRRPLVLAACECARLSLHRIPDGEDRPRIAIETAERWARGEEGVTLDDVRAIARAAYAAACAYAAAIAATATRAAAAIAYTAAIAADPSKCATIVRKHYPTAPEPEENDE